MRVFVFASRGESGVGQTEDRTGERAGTREKKRRGEEGNEEREYRGGKEGNSSRAGETVFIRNPPGMEGFLLGAFRGGG